MRRTKSALPGGNKGDWLLKGTDNVPATPLRFKSSTVEVKILWLVNFKKKDPLKMFCISFHVFFPTPERGRQFIVVRKGCQGTVHGYQQADCGLPKADSWSCARDQREVFGPGQAGELQKHILHTSHHVYLPLSFQRPHSALFLLSPAKSLVWYFDKTPACSALLQKRLSSFDKDHFCRMILEKQDCARCEADPWQSIQCTTGGWTGSAGAPNWLKLGTWDRTTGVGWAEGSMGCQWAVNTKCLQRSPAAEVSSAVVHVPCGHWFGIRQAAALWIICSHPNT